MLFGDETFMAVIQKEPINYDQLYPTVDRLIRSYVLRRISADPHIQEEILQDIHLTVWKNLPLFSSQAEPYPPQQRLSWLYTIASNKLRDWYRRLYGKEQSVLPLSESISAPNADPEERMVDWIRTQESRFQVDTLLYAACALRSRPETKLAFFYNRIIMPLERNHTKKGDIKTVVATLENQTLWDIRCRLEEDLTRVLGRPIPQSVLRALDQSLAGKETTHFHLTPRQVATASYSISCALSNQAPALSLEETRRSNKKFVSYLICGLLLNIFFTPCSLW